MVDDLKKAYERWIDGQTLVDPREHYGALATVDKELLVDLTRHVKGLNDWETTEYNIPGTELICHMRRLNWDFYSGYVTDEKGNQTHLFDRLSLPVLATQLMGVCEMYDTGTATSEEPKKDQEGILALQLQLQIQSISKEVSALKQRHEDTQHAEVTGKLSTLISKLDFLDKLIADSHKENVQKKEQAEPDVLAKLHQLSDMFREAPQTKEVMVHKTGEPELCEDCEADPCACYSHLSKPKIEKSENGSFKIVFGDDFSPLDKVNFLKQMKYVVMRKVADVPPPPPKPAIIREAPEKAKTEKMSDNAYLRAIAAVESSSGKNIKHKEITNKKSMHYSHRAGGAFAIMPHTAHEIVKRHPEMKKKYGDIVNNPFKNHEKITEALNKDHQMGHDLAEAHHGHLMKQLGGDHEKAAHAWNAGLRGTKNAKDIESHYVKKYREAYAKDAASRVTVPKATPKRFNGKHTPVSSIIHSHHHLSHKNPKKSELEYIVHHEDELEIPHEDISEGSKG